MHFTLEPGNWYAAEFISPEFGDDIRSHSPIKVERITPHGQRKFTLDFYHANYPPGVQSKSYELQTIERTDFFTLARSSEYAPNRLLLIYHISHDWIRQHTGLSIDAGQNLADWLERHA